MTEDQAKTKWCPHMFPVVTGQKFAGHNCYADPAETRFTNATKCIASECMMWRTQGVDGYCGLGGKP